MRRLLLVLGLALLAILTIWDIYDFFVTDEGVRYFTSHPRRLGFVAAIAICGGLLALIFSRFSFSYRRRLTLLAVGGVASASTAFLGYFTYSLASVASLITQDGTWYWVLATIASLTVIASLLWFEFYQVYKRPETPIA